MRKDLVIKLLKKLKENNIPIEKVQKVLELSENILKALINYNFDSFKEAVDVSITNYLHESEVLEALEILKKSPYTEYVKMILTDENVLKKGNSLFLAKEFNSVKNYVIAGYLCEILTNSNILNDDILIISAIANFRSVDNEINAKSLKDLLCATNYDNMSDTKRNAIMDALYQICECKNEFNSKYIVNAALNNTVINSAISHNLFVQLRNSANEFNACYVYAFMLNKINNPKFAVKGAKIINRAKTEYNAECCYSVLIRDYNVDLEEDYDLNTTTALSVAKVVNNLKTEKETNATKDAVSSMNSNDEIMELAILIACGRINMEYCLNLLKGNMDLFIMFYRYYAKEETDVPFNELIESYVEKAQEKPIDSLIHYCESILYGDIPLKNLENKLKRTKKDLKEDN